MSEANPPAVRVIASRRPIALGAVGHLLLEITNNFLPVTYPLLIPLLGLSFTQVGLIALVHSFCGTLPQPWLGALAQRWGPQRIIVISLAWSGLFMGLIGLTGSYWLALVLAGLGGFGGGAFHPAGAMSVARIAAGPSGRQRRGAAMSLFSVGGNLGSALSPALMAVALGLFGLPGTGAAVVVGLGSALLVWRLLAPRALASGGDADADGALPGSASSPSPTRPRTERRVYPVLPLALIVVFAMSRSWFQLSITSFLPTWTAESLGSTAWPLVLFMGSVGAGSLSGGRLSDRIGRTRTLLAAALLTIPAHLTFIHGLPSVQLAAVAVLGAALGATLPVAIVMAQERRPHATGVAAGLVIGLGGLPAGIGASVTGLLADAFSLDAALQWTVLALVVGALAVIALAYLEQDRGRPAPRRTPRETPQATPAAPPR